MRLGPKIISAVSLALAAAGCLGVATLAADIIESRSGDAVRLALIDAGYDWTEVHTDGLQVHVGGIAPTEAERFKALHVAGTMVDAARIVDRTAVTPSKPLAQPRLSIEILRNDDGVTLIGLVPDTLDRAAMVKEITALSEGAAVTDLLEAASYPPPPDWESSVQYGLNVLARLPRSKVSIVAGAVTIDAIADSEEEKADLEAAITRRVPDTVEVTYTIAAPRPVITPFTLRFLIDEGGPHFDACSVDTPRNQTRLVKAATEAGVTDTPECILGLGVPTPEWTDAAILGIRAVAELGGGSVTFADADVTLVATETTPENTFDRVVGELESNLPEVFSLHSVLPEPAAEEDGDAAPEAPEFGASLGADGKVTLGGRLNNAVVRKTVESYAKAHFGAEAVHMATRVDEELPEPWPLRVLAALEALSQLEEGSTVVTEDFVEVRGITGRKGAKAEIARILAEKLGEAQDFGIEVTYDEALDPIAALPSPEECVELIKSAQSLDKITFEPSSSEISGSAVGIVNEIADILKGCKDVEMQIEIAGHTDSQGREEMNLELSQSRANAVLEALIARRVLTSAITARGYGEAEPIADNDTEEGREENRRIEFRLLKDEPAAEGEGSESGGTEAEAAESTEPTGEADAAPDTNDGAETGQDSTEEVQ
ncbi:OmpA family protein [Tropicimonas isoalkanivorans]|uniref:OmpA-OmpF porin, OOP family n=1 Tax=Tropicimonas isoalkanivorans TaxID=441112 RepID=A0A1I1NEM4_9RHOB|nr:OmpA family protein [Tropicimonas isoalkanivorans]SFC93223.1 OmpA-OmpF porin, OOP family [Tropicimonas isoalkanivorans]